MATEPRHCQACTREYLVEPDDFSFYERMAVPPPTWCPDCRMVRRLLWRNERTLHRRTCAATGKPVISMFSPEFPGIVYDRDHWWSDSWDQLASGRDYDFSRPFFVQFKELLEQAPLPALANSNMVNSPYGNHNHDCKNCYLIYASYLVEDSAYSYGVVRVRDSQDLYVVLDGQASYDSTLCGNVNKVMCAVDSDDSIDSAFLRACKNLNECLGCVNLKNTSYCIFNEPLSKEEYHRVRAQYDFGSYAALEGFRARFEEFQARYPRRYATILKSQDCTGDNIVNSKNVKHSFDAYDSMENSKFAAHCMNGKEVYDGYGIGIGELLYEGIDCGLNASRNRFAVFTHVCTDVHYAYSCHSSANLFGCVGLRNKQYCILNKQYSKEEYEALVPKIIAQMNEMPYVDDRGRAYGYGEFFPPELSPFAYNESIAQEYFPIDRAAAEAAGFRWREEDSKQYAITKPPGELPDHIRDADDSILQEVIGCAHEAQCNEKCTGAFKLIPSELAFYRHHNLALPRLCPNCRHFRRLGQRNPMKLWRSSCRCAGAQSLGGAYVNAATHPHGDAPCDAVFETPYAPDRPEIVYCEQCYQAETA